LNETKSFILISAIEIFKLNIYAFPESWNVCDSIAEAYMTKEDNELAK
jgi:hypothetical protein